MRDEFEMFYRAQVIFNESEERPPILENSRDHLVVSAIHLGLMDNRDKIFTHEDMREAIAEAWNSCEDNETGETFTQVFDRIIETYKNKL